MANNYWDNSDADNDGNNPNNWSLGNVPTGTDVAVFDNTSDADCTFSGSISCAGLNATADYDGNIDFGDSLSHSWGSSGFVLAHTGNTDMGTGTTHATAGHYDIGSNSGTFDPATSTVTMSGTGNLRGKGTSVESVYNLTIQNGANISQTGSVSSSGSTGTPAIDIAGQLSLNPGIILTVGNNTEFKFRSTANISGPGTLRINTNTISAGGVSVFEAGATVAISNFLVFTPRNGCPIAAGDYQSSFKIQSGSNGGSRATIIGAGNFTCNSLELEAGGITDMVLDLATNNPTVTIDGNLTVDLDSIGDITINASSNAMVLQGNLVDEITGGGTFSISGTQALTLTGTSNQNIDLCDDTWGLITINKAGDVGTVTFSGNLDTVGINVIASDDVDFGDGFTHTYGTSGMVFSHAGNVDLGTGTQHTITNGDFDASGITGNVTTNITSTVIFDGTCAFDLPWPYGRLYDVEVTAGSSLVAGTVTSCGWDGLVLGTGATLTCNGGSTVYYVYHNTRDLTLGDNSRITGTSNYELTAIGPTLTRGSNVIIDPAIFYYRYSHTPMPGEYDCPVEFRSYQNTRTITFPAGTMTVTGNCTMTCVVASSYTMDFAANNGTLVVQGDLVLNIDNASGSLVFDGGSNAIEVQGDVVDQLIIKT
jgi:hypothetical protein